MKIRDFRDAEHFPLDNPRILADTVCSQVVRRMMLFLGGDYPSSGGGPDKSVKNRSVHEWSQS